MIRARDDLIPQVLSMFRRGFDTAAISAMLEIKESAIERVLHVGLDSMRATAKAEMERQRERDDEEEEADNQS